MLTRKDSAPLVVITAILFWGCGAKSDPAPPLAVCNSATCNPRVIVANLGSGGSSNGGAGSTSGITLDVTVVQFAGPSFGSQAWSPENVGTLDGSFEVRASTVNGGVVTSTGVNPVELQNVDNSGTGWVSVQPSADDGFLPGLHLVPLDSGSSLSVPLLRVADFEFVPTLLLTPALAIDPTRAQLVVKIEDAGKQGVPGLTVSSLGGDAMAYASGNNWVDASVGGITTDQSGRVIGINLHANSTTVALSSVTVTGLSAQGVTQSVSAFFPIQAGFVTYGTLLFQ